MPAGYNVNPDLWRIMSMYQQMFHQMPDFQAFMQQRVGPMQDILANQARQSQRSVAGQLSSRGMLGSGAFPAALGGIERGRMGALAQMMPQLQQQYFQNQMQALGGAASAAQNMWMPEIQQPNPFWDLLGELGGSLIPGLFGG